MRITRQRMVDVLGPAPKPKDVWQHQFDGFDEKLVELARMDWDRIPDDYFWYYFLDLAYVELQPDLFRYVFPACLKYWYETLMRNRPAEYGDGDFHYALMRGQVLEKMLSEEERLAVHQFFRDGMLDRLEAERGFLYVPPGESANAWIFRFNSLGIVSPMIPELWESWWMLDHPGKAVSAVMYASGLVYLKGENPIYGVWTPQRGGGGPYLTENDSSLFDWAWREDNLAYLCGTLSFDYVVQKLDCAAHRLAGCAEAEMAARVATDANARADIIEIRIGDLLDNLAKRKPNIDRWD